jgi:hypothetical protein
LLGNPENRSQTQGRRTFCPVAARCVLHWACSWSGETVVIESTRFSDADSTTPDHPGSVHAPGSLQTSS